MTVRRHAVTVLLLLATVTAAACVAAALGGHARDFSNVATFLVALAAGVACLVRGTRRPDRTRWSWGCVGLGALSYAFGEGYWTWFETVRAVEPPFPSWADAGYLAMVPLTVAGLMTVPVAGQSAAHRIRSIIDGLMIAVSLLLVTWIFVLHPLVAAGRHTHAVLAVVLAYPLSDVVLVTVVLYTLAMRRRGGHDLGPLAMVGAAVLVIGISDSLWAYVALNDAYRSGGLLDAGWYAGFAFVLLAARMPAAAEAPGRRDGADDLRPVALVLPYAAVVAALLISVAHRTGADGSDAFGTWTRTALIVLIIARQLLTLLENRRLTRDLESRVATRTAELYAREQRFRALVRHSSDSVAIIDADSTIRYQSESVERIFGYPASMLVGLRLTEVAGRRAAPRIAAAIASVTAEPYATTVVEVLLRHADGRLRQAEMTITNLLGDASVRGLVLNTRDVHDAKELQDQLVHEAYHDGLTGLASRALFREKLHGALAAGTGADVSVLFLDLDGFKEVNDSLGHAAGDQLLIQVAERLRATVREGDTVARFGGDEFAVLIESAPGPDVTGTDEAAAVADRIVAAVGEPFPVGGRDLHVGASVGIASAADARDIEQLERNADLAMYRAKEAGGNSVARYDPQMHDQLVDRLALESDLRLAVQRGELVLHYQPTVDLATGEIAGFEALVRWRHPTRGLVPPLDFIGIAEATGLIVPLGRWVLTEACRQAVAWGGELRMAVNVSVRQFHHGDLAATVAEVLAQTGMPPARLCLEMTESVLLSDTDENIGQLLRLKALGITLAMDDFGTGYSSLAYLRRFPMDVLKIDRSFVDRLGGDPEDEALVHTIVQLGRSLGMATVAEGVENGQQWAALRAMDCDLAQGYFLARPLPAAEAEQLLGTGLSVRASAAV